VRRSKEGEAQGVTTLLNAVHGGEALERDPFLKKAAEGTLRRSRW
jgi:hypothetical protein